MQLQLYMCIYYSVNRYPMVYLNIVFIQNTLENNEV